LNEESGGNKGVGLHYNDFKIFCVLLQPVTTRVALEKTQNCPEVRKSG
jgi:hypothetical protein